MTANPPPGPAARAVTLALAALGLVTGAAVLLVVGVLLLYVGVPSWVVALLLVAVLAGLFVALQRVARSARR